MVTQKELTIFKSVRKSGRQRERERGERER